ncbi:hypothetical protein HYE13_00880 [Mycoplasmopsis bovis]|nr:hypothetical protein [Mycoplasmopsis bovis]QQH25961.1 hypothetical protein HYE13_00880 [Mycoplasmopsis bovis]
MVDILQRHRRKRLKRAVFTKAKSLKDLNKEYTKIAEKQFVSSLLNWEFLS